MYAYVDACTHYVCKKMQEIVYRYYVAPFFSLSLPLSVNFSLPYLAQSPAVICNGATPSLCYCQMLFRKRSRRIT